MVRPKPEEIQKELDQLQKDVYGENTVSGSEPDPESDDDVEQNLSDVTGESIEQIEGDDQPNIGSTVNKAEHDIQHGEINDYEEEDEDDKQVEKKEDQAEDPHGDPYDSFGEDDDADTLEE